MNDVKLIEFFNGRTLAVLAVVLLVVVAVAAHGAGLEPPDASGGLLISTNGWLEQRGWLPVTMGVATIVATGVMLLVLNKMFNFVKSLTSIVASVFFLLEAATPSSTATLNAGSVMVALLAMGTLVLFGCYQNKRAQGPIFLVMCFLTFGVMVEWSVVVLMVAFLLGFASMRALSWRGAVAALLGLVTPLWIVLGVGLATPQQLSLPELHPLWNGNDVADMPLLLAWAAFTAVLTLVLSAVNLLTIYSYRLQLRVYNTFFMIVSLLAVLAMSADPSHITTFLPMLNLCLAVQVAHAFTISKMPKRHIPMALLTAACVAMAVVSLTL